MTRPLKIVRLTTSLDFGGQERKYLSFTQSADSLHHTYIFAAIGKGGHAARCIQDRGFQVELFGMDPAIRNWRNMFRLARWLRRVRPDVVHTAAAEANFHGILAARLARVPVVIGEEIGIPTHSTQAQLAFRAVYTQANSVVCVSKAVRTAIVGMREIPFHKGTIVYNPAVIPAPAPPVRDQVRMVGTLGRLEPIKNHQALLHAMAQLKGHDFQLKIVGGGSQMSSLRALAKSLGIEERTTFTGFSAEPWKELRDCDLFVLPSLSEGFGIAAVEAMLMGVPSVCSEVGGIPEFIEHDVTGWLFQPESHEELTQRVQDVFDMPRTHRQHVAEAARASVISRFTPEKYVRELEGLYESLSTP